MKTTQKHAISFCAAIVIALASGWGFVSNEAQAFTLNNTGALGNSSYSLYTYDVGDPRDWCTAELFAESIGGHLAVSTDLLENQFLRGLITFDVVGSPTPNFWLGGYQPPGTLDANANWTWVTTTEPWVFTHWASTPSGSEPNDAYGPGSEQFLSMESYNTSLGITDVWNDEGDLNHLDGLGGFFVEFDGRPVLSPCPDGGSTLCLALIGVTGAMELARRRVSAV